MVDIIDPPHAAVAVKLPAIKRSSLLENQVAIITGGGRGLGLAIACRLSDAGASVVLAGRNQETLERGAQVIRDRGGGRVTIYPCDLSDPLVPSELVDRPGAPLRPSILVNNAGVAQRCVPDSLSAHDFDRMFATNLRGIYYATIEAAQRFEPGGSIINISSASTQAPDPELIAYTAIKAAVESMTRGLSEIYGKRGIRINGVRPGYTDSPINADRVNDPSRSAELIQSTALKRWGTPSDVADLVCFLASNEASFITGQTISVDGGFPVRQTA